MLGEKTVLRHLAFDRAMLNRAGAHVDCATDGQDGVEQAMAGS